MSPAWVRSGNQVPTDRRAILTAALGFAKVATRTPQLDKLRGWLDSWPGIRWTAVAMRAEHQVLRLQRRSDGWTATFTYVGPTQLPKAAPSGLGMAPTLGPAVSFAARQVLSRHIA